jgi:hypothetical protein
MRARNGRGRLVGGVGGTPERRKVMTGNLLEMMELRSV